MGDSEQEYLEKISNTKYNSSKKVTEISRHYWQVTEVES